MIVGSNTIANMVLGSAPREKNTDCNDNQSSSIQGVSMKKTAVALLSLLGLAVVVKLVRDQI